MRKIVLACALLAMLALNASAFHLIDHFENPAILHLESAGGIGTTLPAVPPQSDSGNKIIGVGGVPPGQRDLTDTINKNILGLKVNIDIVKSTLSLSNPSQARSTLKLEYGDYTTLGAAGALNGDFSGDVGLNFDLIAADQGGSVKVDLEANGNTYSKSFAITTATGTYQVPFASFPGLVASGDLSDVDGIRFTFTGPDAWDITIDQIGSSEDIIPEPATMSLLGLGVLALIRRRRKS